MFDSKNYATGALTANWIFKHYFDIDKAKSVKFKSIFKEEKTPSMFIYERDGKAYYKCFATGKSGDIIDFFANLSGNTYRDVARMLHFDRDYGTKSFNPLLHSMSVSTLRYQVLNYNPRAWYKVDKEFWGSYGIPLSLCEHYKIYPLSSIKIGAVDDEVVVKEYELDGLMYGYEDQHGFYKIYSPFKKLKFFSIRAVLQGAEQCINHENLLITSSMKDILALKAMGVTNIDIIAPPSETSYLQDHELEIINKHYKRVVTLFDNDTAGINMMINYRDKYGFNACKLTLAKDPSDAVKYFGKEKTLVNLVPSIHNALYVDL